MNDPDQAPRDPATAAGIGSDADSIPPPPPPPPPPPEPPPSRRLHRSRDQMIGGVAGGVAEYFDIDPVIPRIAFVLLALANGIGVVIYIVLWIVVPQRPVGAVPGTPGYVAGGRGASGSGSMIGAIVVGTVLVAIGVAWLLAALDIADLTRVRWELALPIALIATGAALVVASARGGSGGLIMLGAILTVALVVSSPFRLGFDGAFGEQAESPATIGELEDGYSHVFGSLRLDLRRLEVPEGETDIETSVVFGSIEIRLPDDPEVGVRVQGSTVFGSTEFPDRTESSGIAADRTYTSPNYSHATRRLDINVSSVFGSSEIRP